MSELSIVVVGAGVVGASAALALQQDGHQVTLLDKEGPCAGASFGNAGAIVNASSVPNAMPGISRQALAMLRDPLHPVSIRPGYFFKILPWLIRFIAQSRPQKVRNNAQALIALTQRATEGWDRLVGNTALARLLASGGWMRVYENQSSFDASIRARDLMDEMGTAYTLLDAKDIQDLEPELAPIYKYGVIQDYCKRILNPQAMVEGMVKLFVERGGCFKKFDVSHIRVDEGQAIVSGARETLSADKVILCAGAWSRTLARQMGDAVPLDTERGYHLMLSVGSSKLLKRPVMNGDVTFVLSPMETGLRLSSQVEFAGLNGNPDYRHIRSLLPHAKRMLPAVDTKEQSVWMGFRPSLPDSLPVLGRSTQSERVLYAFGHQHLGMSLGPITGIIMADVVAGRDPGLDLSPYRAGRF